MPDLWMDVDTALTEVPVNILPLTDDTDFKSIEAAVTYNATGMALVWHFVTTAGVYNNGVAVTPTTSGAYDWTDHGTHGIYTIEIPASGGASINNDTEGFGWFTGSATGVLPWRGPTIGFRAEGLNNALIDSAYSTTRGLSGTALPAAAADAAGGLPISDAGGLDIDAKIGALTFTVAGDVDVNVQSWKGSAAQDMTGDAYARLGAPAGASVSADIVVIDNFVDDLESRLTAARAGYLDNLNTGVTLAADAITAAKIADDAFSSEHFNTGCMTADAFAADAIVAATLATGCLTVDAFAADALVAATFATDCITDDAIATGAIASTAFATGAITNAAVADDVDVNTKTITAGAITATVIADAAIDLATFAADCKTGSALKANVETITNDAITAASIANGAIDAATFAAGAIDAAAIAANAIDFATFAADCKTGTGLKANVETVTNDAITAAAIAAGAIDAATFAADVAASIATMVWNAAVASYGGAGTYGQAVEDMLVDTGTTLDAKLELVARSVVYKWILTTASGNLAMYDAAGDLIGTVAGAFVEDATTKTRLKLVP